MPPILVVDDEASVRALLKRLLAAEFDAEISEAVDGLQALEHLLHQNTTLVLLDVNMPVMNGVETLEAIRRSPRLQGLPVAMMTATRDEALVRRVIKLGVSEFLLKPLRREIVIERLARLLGPSVPTSEGRPARLLDLEPGAHVLIVDGSQEFRQFFRQQLGTRYVIHEAQNGVEALRHCLEAPPQAMFVASDIEVLDAEMLVRKLRLDPKLRSMAMIALVPEHALDALPRRNIYDGILIRTFVDETFEASFQKLLVTGERPPLLAEGSPIVRQIVMAAGQVCSMLLRAEATVDQDAAIRETSSRRWCLAAVEVHTSDEAIDLRVMTSIDAARELTGHRLDTEPRLLGEQDLLATVQEVASTLAETLSQALTRRGIHSGCGVPRVECVTSVGAPPRVNDESFQFSLSAADAQLVVRLDRLRSDARLSSPASLPA